MKKIIYTRPDGGVSVVNPAPGERLALSVKDASGSVIGVSPSPIQLDRILRRQLAAGEVVEWGESEDEFVARVAAKDVPADATNMQIVDASSIPTDRSFRDAWKACAGGVEHDIEKCQAITKDRLRRERAPKLEALDVDFMRASEEGRPTTEIVAKKQALRDITKQVDGVTDLEALKAIKA